MTIMAHVARVGNLATALVWLAFVAVWAYLGRIDYAALSAGLTAFYAWRGVRP